MFCERTIKKSLRLVAILGLAATACGAPRTTPVYETAGYAISKFGDSPVFNLKNKGRSSAAGRNLHWALQDLNDQCGLRSVHLSDESNYLVTTTPECSPKKPEGDQPGIESVQVRENYEIKQIAKNIVIVEGYGNSFWGDNIRNAYQGVAAVAGRCDASSVSNDGSLARIIITCQVPNFLTSPQASR